MEHRLCRGIFPRKITKVINVGSYSFSIHKKIFRVPRYISIMNIQNFRFKDHPFGIFVALITFDKKEMSQYGNVWVFLILEFIM